MYRLIKYIFFILLLISSACKEHYTPKSPDYARIDFPEKKYRWFDSNPDYKFEYPDYAIITKDSLNPEHAGWLNIEIPSLKGTIYLSYSRIHNNLPLLIEDSRNLVYKHTIKAESIEEIPLRDLDHKKYGILYNINGNTASSVQFFITDSTRNFLRGSLYFNAEPNKDSLAPVIKFVSDDIHRLLESLEWKAN